MGGAHRGYDEVATSVQNCIVDALKQFNGMDVEQLLDKRYERLMSFGKLEVKS